MRDTAGWALGVVDMELETLSPGHQGGLQPHERRDLSAALSGAGNTLLGERHGGRGKVRGQTKKQ